jgi:hypothetical protein
MADTVDSLVSAVARRHYLARLGRAAALAVAIACAVQLAALLTLRLTGLLPAFFGWSTLALPPLIGLAIAVLAVRPTQRAAAARLTDRGLGAEDLFVTACDAQAPGEYRPLVAKQAAAKAEGARPATIVPWRPLPRSGIAAGAVIALAAATLLVPQLDPFGRQARAQQSAKRAKALEQVRDATKQKLEELKAREPEAKVSAEVAEELKKLQATLDAMKPDAQAANQKALEAAKSELAVKLEQERADRFGKSVDEGERAQELGAAADRAAAEAMKKQLEKGETAEAEKAIDELKTLADQLEKTKDPAERAKLAEKMHRQLKALEEAAKSQPAGFTQAVRQALDQLAQAGNQDLSDQSLQALRDSLDLARLEMQSSAQGERDLQSMQEALQAMHLAQKLNEKGGLNGADSQGLATLEDYKKLYADALAKLGKQGKGDGGGQGGEGQGDGSKRESDDTVKSDFAPEQDSSPLSAGKTLMQWKTHGQAEAGKVQEDYLPAVRAVQQGVSEALVREQVPPGYHDGVKKYFDGLEPGK